MKALLISNSGRPYLGHCRTRLLDFLTGTKRVGFVSAAFFGDPDEYFQKVFEALKPTNFELIHLNVPKTPVKELETCDGVLVGGGNTYRLLKLLTESGYIGAIRERVKAGMPYCGWSAGANIAGPTILTTNDWNVVGFSKFEAIGLVKFNLNPHYKEADPLMAQFSETRDDRIAEYHKANSNTVIGVEEQTLLLVEDKTARVYGEGRAFQFEAGKPKVPFRNGDTIPV